MQTMKDLTRGELLFSFVCLQLLASVVSLNWTLQPSNPTLAVEGQTVSLTWRYSLTANEQTSSRSFFTVRWSKFNYLSSVYDEIGSKIFISLLNPPLSYREPLSPHVVVDKNNESNSATLHINGVRRDDEGRYKIEYISDLSGTVVADQEVNVTVLVVPAFDYMSNDTDVCEGSLGRLSCNATGIPQPSITWTQVLDKDTDSAPLPAIDGTYVIPDVNRSSNGTIYRCTAENEAGAVNRTVQVTVKYSPFIDEIRNSSNTVIEGGSFSMTCAASGGPENYTWFRIDNDKQIGNDAVLIFNNISRNDTGQYRCEAKNQCGNGSKVQSVDVYFPPHITDISRNQTVTEGDTVYLNCTPDGNPAPNITWTRLSNNSEVTMPLTGINRQEGGFYRCTADNGVGRPATKDTYIIVQFPTSTITNISGNITKNDGDEVVLTCKADGNPEPNITWTRPPSNTAVPSPFIITGKQDEGAYRCTADNSIGRIDSRGRDVFISVVNYRPFGTSFTANLVNNVANLSKTFDLTCSADASPAAKYRLYREQESLINTTVGNSSLTHPTMANKRQRQMIFRCTPFNEYGDGPTEIIPVTVHFEPVNVTLVANTTENKNCSKSLWVNFTCVTSEANPPVESYRLHAYRIGSNVSKIGTWNEEVSREGEHVYNCLAQHKLGTVNSSNVIVTFNVPVNISVSVAGSTTLKENDSLFLNCSASGFPRPTGFTWTKRGDNAFNAANSWLNFPGITPEEAGGYICHANNTCGEDNSSVISINVQYEPKNVTLSNDLSSTEVCAVEMVNFTCTAESANPPVHNYTLYQNGSEVRNTGTPGIWTIPLNIGGKVIYKCEANNSVRPVESNDVTFSVEVGASVTVENKAIVVDEGETVTLVCNVSGFPSPDVFWVNNTNGQMKSGNIWQLPNISRNDAGEYNCSASNACGNATERAVILVRFSPRITLKEKYDVERGENAYLHCRVEAYPSPTILWVPCNAQERVCDSSFLNISNVQTQRASYTCTVTNERGQDSETTTLVIGGNNIYISMAIITDEKCTEGASWRKQIIVEMDETFANINGYSGAKVLNCRLGSVIVDLGLTFSVPVAEDFIISTIQSAIQDGKLGELSVNASSIIGILPVITSTATPPTSTTTPKSGGSDCEESFFKDTSCSIKLEVAVGISVAAVGLIVMTAAAVGYWIHKKRKCRKDTRIAHEPGCEEQRLQGDDPYAQVNNGYAETGPRSVNSREKAAAAVPDYAVVDKSAKKKKKKQDEEKPPEYAVVDKSKKKKKNEKGDDTYAKVDMSKKTSKKKPRPGEDMLYADLGDFNGASQMPTVATSPKAQPQLPPIKRPEPYEGTQYADITQFLKGDATLPVDDKQVSKQGTELKEKDEKTDGAGGENAPKETPM